MEEKTILLGKVDETVYILILEESGKVIHHGFNEILTMIKVNKEQGNI
jgi:hypothetical protein